MEDPKQLILIPKIREGIKKHYENATYLYNRVLDLLKLCVNEEKSVDDKEYGKTAPHFIYFDNLSKNWFEVILEQDKISPNKFTLVMVDCGPGAYDLVEDTIEKIKRNLQIELSARGVKDVEGEDTKIILDTKVELYG